jgi:hypothetical protein
MSGFYDVENLGDFQVYDIPSREDVKQSLAIAKDGPNAYTTAQRDILAFQNYFQIGAVILNTTTSQFQGFSATGPSSTGTWAVLG